MASGQRPPRTEILLAGVDARVAGRGRRAPSGALRTGRYKLVLGVWGDSQWCDLNRSGFSPGYPFQASIEGGGGEGGLVCVAYRGEASRQPTSRALPSELPWSELVTGLYDVVADPREERDLQHERPKTVRKMLMRMLQLNRTAVQSIHKPDDPAAVRLAEVTNCWQPWQDE